MTIDKVLTEIGFGKMDGGVFFLLVGFFEGVRYFV